MQGGGVVEKLCYYDVQTLAVGQVLKKVHADPG